MNNIYLFTWNLCRKKKKMEILIVFPTLAANHGRIRRTGVWSVHETLVTFAETERVVYDAFYGRGQRRVIGVF